LITSYADDLLEGLVRLWNSSFSGKRNFRMVTPQTLRSYCINREDFDPEGLFLAIDGHEVVGIGHAGFAGKGRDRDKGLIHLLVVRSDMRRKGIGWQLLNSCESFLSGTSTITIGPMGEEVFYSYSRSSLLPLWGSSEGIGIEASDYETRNFLEKRGYRQLDSMVSMVVDLSNIRGHVTDNAGVVPVPDRWVMAGHRLEDETNDFWPLPAPCKSFVYLEEGVVAGKIVTYSMSELGPRRAAILDFWVHEPCRGKGIGSILLDATLHRLLQEGYDEVELKTNQLESPLAYAMYKKRGFRIAAEWCSYQKKR